MRRQREADGCNISHPDEPARRNHTESVLFDRAEGESIHLHRKNRERCILLEDGEECLQLGRLVRRLLRRSGSGRRHGGKQS